jgi:hypothetical protein
LERLERAFRQRAASRTWQAEDPHPAELLKERFWFASIEDPAAFRMLDLIGAEHVMVESDFPHRDSTWPRSQEMLERELQHLPVRQIQMTCYQNASRLYGHPGPPDELLDLSIIGQRGPDSAT